MLTYDRLQCLGLYHVFASCVQEVPRHSGGVRPQRCHNRLRLIPMRDVKLEHVIIGAQSSPMLGGCGTKAFVYVSLSRGHDRLLKRFD